MSIRTIRIKVCDSCDEPILLTELQVSHPLALGASIDLHKRCADREPNNGATTELARKARANS